jgi:hypothetical protein
MRIALPTTPCPACHAVRPPTAQHPQPLTPYAPRPRGVGNRPDILGVLANIFSASLVWWGSFIPLAFVTQIYAGSTVSPGGGGGFSELFAWTNGFGVMVLILVAIRSVAGSNSSQRDARAFDSEVFQSGAIGYGVAAVVAIVWFMSKGGPSSGNWFIGPLGATIGVAYSLFKPSRFRP